MKMMHVKLRMVSRSVVKMVIREIRAGVRVLMKTELFLLNRKFLRHFSKLECIKIVTETSRPTLIIVNVQLIISTFDRYRRVFDEHPQL